MDWKRLLAYITDLGETTDLAENETELAQQPLEQLRTWREETGAAPTLPNPLYQNGNQPR